jgi:glyoxylase-like metal-dependent hydrolase (beta-lactamase superfamily II)
MSTQTEWTVRDLKERLDRQEDFFILDVRSRAQSDASKIEGRKALPITNIPYSDMLAAGGKDDAVESVAAYAQNELPAKLPKDRPTLVVCAKGVTSERVTQGLRRSGYNAINLQGGMKAWGDFYQAQPIVETRELSIYQMSRPSRGCLSYVIASEGQAMVIDPLRHLAHYLALAGEKGLAIRYVLDTHAHADHISGAADLAAKVGAPYYLHPYDAIHPIDVLPARLRFNYLIDGQEFSFGKAKVKAIHIPGHTLGNLAYRLNENYLFAGDSIFINSIARPDLGGRSETWAPLHYRSLNRLLALPDETVVLPGHFSSPAEAQTGGLYMSSLDELKRQNEGLKMAQNGEASFVQYILDSLPKFPPQYVDIKRVNAGLLAANEEKASELELGKNICALATKKLQ